MKFPMKIDTHWHGVFIAIFIAATLLTGHAIGSTGYFFSIAAAILWIFFALAVIPMWVDSHYLLTDSGLIIKFGPFRLRINYKRIVSVQKAEAGHRARLMGLASERVLVTYTKNHYQLQVLICPKDEEAFLNKSQEKLGREED